MRQGTSQTIDIRADGEIVAHICREAQFNDRTPLASHRLDHGTAEFIASEIAFLHSLRLTLAFTLREFQNLADDGDHLTEIAGKVLLDITLLLFGNVVVRTAEYLREACDGIQRRTDFVSHTLNEGCFHAVRLLCPCQGLLQLLAASPDLSHQPATPHDIHKQKYCRHTYQPVHQPF